MNKVITSSSFTGGFSATGLVLERTSKSTHQATKTALRLLGGGRRCRSRACTSDTVSVTVPADVLNMTKDAIGGARISNRREI